MQVYTNTSAVFLFFEKSLCCVTVIKVNNSLLNLYLCLISQMYFIKNVILNETMKNNVMKIINRSTKIVKEKCSLIFKINNKINCIV